MNPIREIRLAFAEMREAGLTPAEQAGELVCAILVFAVPISLMFVGSVCSKM